MEAGRMGGVVAEPPRANPTAQAANANHESAYLAP